MNEETLKGQWTQLKGRVREQWGKLTNDDIDQIQGRTEQLVGKIQERYGIAKAAAKREADAWMKMMESSAEEAGTPRGREMAGKR